MKKKKETSKLFLDKKTITHLNFEQLSEEKAQEIQGGVTAFTACCTSCGNNYSYTSCLS